MSDPLVLRDPPPGFVDDPWPVYRRLRDEAPVHPQPDGSMIVSRHATLDAIYRDTALYSSDKRATFAPVFGESPLYRHHTTSLVFNDPPLHTRVRRIITGALTPSAIRHMEPGLVRTVNALLDDLAGSEGEIDLVSTFAANIPLDVIGNLFDMPHAERGPLRDWSLSILGALEPAPSSDVLVRGNAAVVEFGAYLHELAERRRARPGDPATDVLTRLLQAGHGDGSTAEALSMQELVENCIFILNAGHETTTNLIASALCTLDRHGPERERLVETPALLGTAIDEVLRLESPNQFGNRVTTGDVTLDGVRVPAGTNLHLCIGAANRDERAFDRADDFVPDRKPNRHLAFAGGPHACIGLNLARLEGRIAVGRFLARFPRYRVTDVVRSPRSRFRGFERLGARLGADR